MLWINRSLDLIRGSRKELEADYKLDRKIENYARMSKFFNWTEIRNNGLLEETKQRLSDWLDGKMHD